MASYLLIFPEWMAGLLVFAGVGPIPLRFHLYRPFHFTSVVHALFFTFLLHSHFPAAAVVQSVIFFDSRFNSKLPWVSHVHTVNRVYISRVMFYFTFYWFWFHWFHSYCSYPFKSLVHPSTYCHSENITWKFHWPDFMSFSLTLYNNFLFTLFFMCWT